MASSVPSRATLYFVGPYNFDIFVNGANVSHVQLGGPVLVHDRPVIVLDVTANLRVGLNALAVKASAGVCSQDRSGRPGHCYFRHDFFGRGVERCSQRIRRMGANTV